MLQPHARVVWLAALAASAAACQSPGPGPVATPPGAVAALRDPEAIRWVRDSAEYVAAAIQTYRAATSRVEQEGPRWPTGTWVVVLDADETVISSLEYQIERARAGLAFTPESWAAWVRRREGVPIPGAAAFLDRVRSLGGRIAIVTNRHESECADTVAAFRAHRLAHDAMLCRPDGSPSDKTARFEAVAAGRTPAGSQPLTLVAVVGDNIIDFPGMTQSSRMEGALADFGVRYFIVPNPMYGSWQETARELHGS
jgi:5'-nucleotidase (lipoprotein e(P4) family)